MEDEFAKPEYFDFYDALQSNMIPAKGKKITVSVKSSKELATTILKSDTASVQIPEIEFEEVAGTGRLATIADLLTEAQNDIEGSMGHISQEQVREKYKQFLDKIFKMRFEGEPFTLILDDPVGHVFVKEEPSTKQLNIKEEFYERTWSQNKELTLMEPKDTLHLETSDEKYIPLLQKYFNNCKKIFALTGAGISVESGIPSFRGSADSFWEKHDPSEFTLSKFLESAERRTNYWKIHQGIVALMDKSQPNPSHSIFKSLESQGKLLGVATQNIDDLHERSGISPSKLFKIHGSAHDYECLSCHAQIPRKEIEHQMEIEKKTLPSCPTSQCDGIVKPKVVFFGEALDGDVLKAVRKCLEECDLLLVMGTSLLVAPANKLPEICFDKKTPVIMMNMEETELDQHCDVVIRGPCGKAFAPFVNQ